MTRLSPLYNASISIQTEIRLTLIVLSSLGVLLSVCLSPDPAKKAFLLVVDASNMEELARAEVDVRVHRDFHGEFLPAGFIETKTETEIESVRL